jgi:hypothetical protein
VIEPMARDVAEREVPAATLATPDIGVFGWYSGARILDLGGLTDQRVATLVERVGYDAMMEQALFLDLERVDYVVDRSPERERFRDRTTRGRRWRVLMTGPVQGLGISRPETYYYTLYALEPESALGALEASDNLAVVDRQGGAVSATLFATSGGRIVLPLGASLLVSRENGGALLVLPPRPVWERSELAAAELADWSFLVAAAGGAMLESLPQSARRLHQLLEAGNWALHDDAEPRGPKTAPAFRQMHLHLLGRSRRSTSPAWKWGESPRFPAFAERHTWGRDFEPLRAAECLDIVTRLESRLRQHYDVPSDRIVAWKPCARCGYPTTRTDAHPANGCELCGASSSRP